MKPELKQLCDQFIINRDVLTKTFFWDNSRMWLAGSIQLLVFGAEADEEKLKKCRDMLKSKAGVFSRYRGYVQIPLLCRISQEADPEMYLEHVMNLSDQLQKGIFDNEYTVIAAMTIADHVSGQEEEACVQRTLTIYDQMKENHPWITGQEDLTFAAALAVLGKHPEKLMEMMEDCYRRTKDFLAVHDARQTLSQVLALNERTAEEKCGRTEMIWNGLKQRGHRFGHENEVALLGELACTDLTTDEIIQDIIDADDYLRSQKGFGDFLFGAENRRTFAAALALLADHSSDDALQAELVSTIEIEISITMAMLECMLIANSVA